MIKCDLFLTLLGHCSCLVLKEPETKVLLTALLTTLLQDSGFRSHCLVPEGGATPSRPHGKVSRAIFQGGLATPTHHCWFFCSFQEPRHGYHPASICQEHSPMAVVTMPSLLPTLQWRQPCPAESYPNLPLVGMDGDGFSGNFTRKACLLQDCI